MIRKQAAIIANRALQPPVPELPAGDPPEYPGTRGRTTKMRQMQGDLGLVEAAGRDPADDCGVEMVLP